MATITRRAVWRTGAANGWHDDLIWFAAAVHQMKLLTPDMDEFITLSLSGDTSVNRRRTVAIARQWADPLSWGYQSQVHGTWGTASQWPIYRRRRVLWEECAHNQWFFLPWHRAYLLEFEDVVREHIRRLGGPADSWALPYWNYTDYRTDRRRLGLPQPLRGATLPPGVAIPGVDPNPDGTTPNPLFTPERALTGDPPPGTPATWADATDALQRPHYANQEDTAAVSFGGGVVENVGADFHNGREIGQLDASPHGAVHNQVGGSMWLFETAALDPVFWLHHGNVDRLWETYAHNLRHRYPFDNGVAVGTRAHTSWRTRPFRFLRPDGTVRTWRSPQLTDIIALGYRYDTTTPPRMPPAPPPPDGSEVDPIGLDVPPAEPIAATGPVALADTTEVAVVGAPALADRGAGSFGATTWLLVFDGIRAAEPVRTSYDVFVGLDADAAPDPGDAAHYAGVLSLFGVVETTRAGSATDGQRRVLDVTGQVRAQGDDFLPAQASVRLVPLNPHRRLGGARVTIERVTLEFA